MDLDSILIPEQSTKQTIQVPVDLKLKISELQEAILAAHPRLPLLLREIHSVLKADPDNVTLLNEDEIGIIVIGLKKQTATEIATAALKSKSKGLKNTILADL